MLSPIGIVPKKAEGKFRLIHHLSYPYSHSINDGIPDDKAQVYYATFDAAVTIVREIGPNCYMSKTDIKSAYRLVPITPTEYHLLGFTYDNQYYFDTNLPMGLKSSCKIFETFSSALEQAARLLCNIPHITHLLDDFLIVAKTKYQCAAYLHSFLGMCDYIGVPIAEEKTFAPTKKITYLGIELDTETFEARLPAEKVDKCRLLLSEAQSKKKLTLRQIQQLTGSLNFACQVIVPGRAFLRRLINLSIGLCKPYYHIRLSSEARKDLNAWSYCMSNFNRKSILSYSAWIPAISPFHFLNYTLSWSAFKYGVNY